MKKLFFSCWLRKVFVQLRRRPINQIGTDTACLSGKGSKATGTSMYYHSYHKGVLLCCKKIA